LIERLEAEGGYSEDFLSEFRIFRKELRGFFSASTFVDILDAIRPSLDDSAIQVRGRQRECPADSSFVVYHELGGEPLQAVDHLVAAKAVVDEAAAPSDGQLVDALHALTTVRAIVADGLSSGQRNDAPDSAIAMRQRWRLAELRAEEYAFVLLSRLLTVLLERVRLCCSLFM
jgi:phosphoglucan,water dikinase